MSRTESLLPVLSLAFLALAAPAAAEQAEEGQARPNIVFVLIDTLRADHLGCYGYGRDTSPTLDEIAAESVVFTDAVAPAPWTCPSMASVFTSLYPRTHRVLDHGNKYQRRGEGSFTDALADSIPTLAEGLREAGYATGGFVAAPWMNVEFGFGQGFEVYDDVRGGEHRSGESVHQAAVRWLETRDPKRPFFLYVHYMEVHGPYNAPPEFRRPFVEPLRELAKQGKLTPLTPPQQRYHSRQMEEVDPELAKYMEYYVARYDAGIRWCDTLIARLRGSLEALGLWDKAFVVITADHGEELGEHGGGDHGYNLHVHQLRVPLMIRTGWELQPATIEATVSLMDLAPTLWEVGGAVVPAGAQGKSLVSMLRDPGQQTASFAFAEGVKRKPTSVSVQFQHRKLMTDTQRGKPRYYDLVKDPMEQHPALAPTDEIAARLQPALNDWIEQTQKQVLPKAPEVTIDPETERLLKSIGYLGDDEDEE